MTFAYSHFSAWPKSKKNAKIQTAAYLRPGSDAHGLSDQKREKAEKNNHGYPAGRND